MAENNLLLALFADVDPAAHGVDALREAGVREDEITIISGAPITEPMMGRAHHWTNVPRLALGGAVAGFFVGLFFTFTPNLYPLFVGGQPLVSVPPGIIVVFEMTMLLMLISTFVGVFLDSRFPSYTPKEYVPEISDGKIGVLFHCPEGVQAKITEALKQAGAESVKPAEAQQL